MQRLSSQLIGHVASFLGFLDIYLLRQVERRLNALLKPECDACRWPQLHNDIRRVVVQRLVGRVPDPERFLKSLHAHNNWLTGSFLLSCVLGDSVYDGADLDVYVVSASDTLSGQEQGHYTPFIHDAFGLERKFYTDQEFAQLDRVTQQLCELQRGFEGKLGVVQEREGYALFPVCQRKYRVMETKTHLDYVVIERSQYKTVAAYASKCCDFAFCAIIFDGERLMIRDLDAVRLRQCRCDLAQIPIVEDCGYQGYEQVYKQIQRARHRAKKYTERGFRIDLVLPDRHEKCSLCNLCYCGCEGTCCTDTHDNDIGRKAVATPAMDEWPSVYFGNVAVSRAFTLLGLDEIPLPSRFEDSDDDDD